MIVNGNLKFHTLGSGELQNAVIERLDADPVSSVAGRIYYNTVSNVYKFYDGTNWVTFATGGNAAALQQEVDNIESAIGAAVNTQGQFQSSGFSGAIYISNPTSITDAIMQLDAALNANNTLAELDDVSLTSLQTGDVLRYDTNTWKNAPLTLGLLNNVASGVDSAADDDILAFDSGTSQWTAITPATFAAGINLDHLGDVTISSVSPGHVLYYDSSNQWKNAAPGATSGVQGYDVGLANLAAGGTGIVSMNGDNVFYRSLVPPTEGFTINNANGVGGNPTFLLANDLAAYEGLTTTGYVVRTGDGAATTRAIDGMAGRIVVSNGDGVGSNTNIDLATVTQSSSGNFVKVTIDAYGRVSGNTPVVASDITGLVDSHYVNVTGDTMTGTLTMSGAGVHIVLPNTPTSPQHAANKAYVDQVAEGLQAKPAVEIIVTKPADIAALGSFTYNNGTNGVGATLTKNGNGAWPTIDGVLLTSTTMGENGVLIAFPNNTANAVYNGRYNLTQVGDNNNPWILTRCGLCDEGNEIPGSYTFVKRGTTYAGTGWVQVQGTDVDTDGYLDVGTDQIWLFQFSGAGTYTAGTGLSLNGTQFNVNLGAGIVELPGDEVGIHLYSPTAGGLILTTDGSGRSSDTNAMLHLLLKTNGGLTQDADGLYIPAGGVSNAMLANSTFTVNGDNGSDVVNLGETILFAGTAAQGISTTITNNTVTISAANASSSQKGVASFAAGDFDVTAGHVTIKAGGVDNAQLAHSTITVGGDTGTPDAIALGQSLSVVGGTSHISTSMNDVTNTLSISFDSPFEGLNDVQGTSSAANGSLLQKTSGLWQPTTPAALFNSQTINSLSDVNATHADGAVLTSNGSQWVAQQIYYLYDGATANTTHVVTHGLGVKYCNVTVVDSSDEVVIPQSIKFDSTSQLTVTFNTAITCKVIVMGVA